LDRNTGARGLRSILENILLDTMFDLPGIDGVNEIMVNSEVVQNNSKPLHIYEKQTKALNKKA
jgi:ATP-dependent Clp protease ATP-binding subunit ClpX